MTYQQEEDLLMKPVLLDGGSACGKLVAIFTDGYETTCGITKHIVPCNDKPVKYDSEHFTYLPVMFHKQSWLFPDGKIGSLTVDFHNHDKPFVSEDGEHWSYVTATGVDDETVQKQA